MQPQTTLTRLARLLLLAALLLAACGPATPGAPGGTPAATASPANQEVILWYAFSGAPETALLQLIDDFNVHNAWNVTVAAERLGSRDSLLERVLGAYRHQALPDLIVADDAVAADLMRAGASVPLDDYVSLKDYGLSQNALADLRYPLRQSHFDQRVIAWPLGREVVVLAYNAKWLNSMGLADPPDRWSEFGDIACAASRDVDGDGAFDHYGYWYVNDFATLEAWLHSRGSGLVAEGGRTVRFTDEPGLETFRLLRDLFNRACAQQAGGPDGARAAFAAGTALFAFPHSGELPAYERDIATDQHFQMGIAPLPATGTLSPTVGLAGPDLVLLRTNPNRQLAAWLLIRYLTDTEQAVRWATATGQFPVRRTAVEDERVQQYWSSHPQLATAWALEPLAHHEEPLPGWPAAQSILARTLDQVIDGDVSRPITATVAGAAGEVQNALDQAGP